MKSCYASPSLASRCVLKRAVRRRVDCSGELHVYYNRQLTSFQLTLTALNSSRTAYASFSLNARSFFISYNFSPSESTSGDRFTCQLYNRVRNVTASILSFRSRWLPQALVSVFKGRGLDARGRDVAVERCDVSVQDQPDKTECRLAVKMLCKNGTHHDDALIARLLLIGIHTVGVTKTYRLTYESVDVMHALFDKTSASYGWTISSRVLREYIEYFGPKTEQLDMVAQEGRATFTSFTEKIQDGKREFRKDLYLLID